MGPTIFALLLLATAAAAQPLFNVSADVHGVFRTRAGASQGCDNIYPGLKADQLCSTTGMNSDPMQGCAFVGASQLVYYYGSPADAPCYAFLQAPAVQVSKSGQPLPCPLEDRRPLKPTLPQQMSEKEGATLYWLYRNYLNYALWVRCAASIAPKTVTPGIPHTGDPAREFLVPPGWTPFSTLWLEDGNTDLPARFLPFASILFKGRQMLVLIRSSASRPDWLSDFDYTLTTANAQLPLPGKVHRGIYAIASALWPGLKSALFRLREDQDIQNVQFSGHSLGGGVGAMLAYAAQEYLDELVLADYKRHYGVDAHDGADDRDHYSRGGGRRLHAEGAGAGSDDAAMAWGEEESAAEAEGYSYGRHERPRHLVPLVPDRWIKVDAALFAPAGAGDATFAAAFGRRVNARHISFLYDLVSQVPCSPMVACPNPPALVSTFDPANGPLWAYVPLPGAVTLLPSGMATNQAEWANFQTPYDCTFPEFASATHTCSYLCYFSRYVDDTSNLCLLSKSSGTKPGSFCYGFWSTNYPDYPASPPTNP